jgi:transposase
MDETTLSLHPPLRCCWMKQGEQKRIETPGQQESVHFFGGYNWQSDQVHGVHHPKRNSEGFCRFLDHLMNEVYPQQKVILVMDNASIHTSRLSQAALSLYDTFLQVVYLPKYCPFLNPIERFWQHLKALANANRLHGCLADLITCAEHHLVNQNDMQNQERFTFSKNI